MELSTFLLEAVLISLSGVMAPGPMTAVTLSKGTNSPRAGLAIALGHGLFEGPLMGALVLGFGHLQHLEYLRPLVGLVGGAVLLLMGLGLVRGLRPEIQATAGRGSPLWSGFILSAANPYFLIWWLTVGAALLLRAEQFGATGLLAFGVAHWLCDLVWYGLLAGLAYRGGRFFGRGFQRVVFLGCGIFLLFLGGRFIWEAVQGLYH